MSDTMKPVRVWVEMEDDDGNTSALVYSLTGVFEMDSVIPREPVRMMQTGPEVVTMRFETWKTGKEYVTPEEDFRRRLRAALDG